MRISSARFVAPFVALVTLALAPAAFAQDSTPPDDTASVTPPAPPARRHRHGPVHRDPVYSQSHPVALGIRTSVRVGSYVEGGFGGHFRVRPHRLVAIELFSDNLAAAPVNGLFRHDHEIGGTLQYTGLGGPRWSVYPMLGACAMLVVVQPLHGDGPTATDIHFGVHAGLGAEVQLVHGLAIQAQLEAIGYVGHDVQVYNWSAQVSPDLRFYPVGQLVVGANYYF